MDLPSELKDQIILSIPPAERRHLRLVNKSMLNAVAKSMRDVLKIAVEFSDKGPCRVLMTTVNPYNGTTATYDYKTHPWSLSFVLHWAGMRTESLSVKTAYCFAKEGSRLVTLRRVFEALNTEDACPNLTQLSVASCRLLSDEVIVLSHVLEYVTKRQQQVKATADRSPPFLCSLSLSTPWCCCGASRLGRYAARLRKHIILAREREEIARTAATSRLINHGPPIHPPAQPNLLQDILDQCEGLKVLNVDELLMRKFLPVVALRYPTTLTHLKTARLGETPGELRLVVDNCPRLETVEELCGGFTRDDADIRALVSLTDLRSLSIVSEARGDRMVELTDLSLAAFGEHPSGPHFVHPWPRITSIALNYVTGDFLQLLSRGCPTLQEVRIQVLANTPAVTAEMLMCLCDLSDLRVLIVQGMQDEREVMFGNSLLDAIASKCPHLEQLCLFPCPVSLLSLPVLLRECPRLRSVALRSLSVALETRDCLVMVRSLEHDLCDREVTIVLQVKEITGEDYNSVKRIIDGLGAGTVMAMSSMTDVCVHDLEVCARCCFNAPEAQENARRVEKGGPDLHSRSFVLGQRRRPNAAIVFVASGKWWRLPHERR